ncbi:hypothetical protein D3C76_814190 [compost metagenome]
MLMPTPSARLLISPSMEDCSLTGLASRSWRSSSCFNLSRVLACCNPLTPLEIRAISMYLRAASSLSWICRSMLAICSSKRAISRSWRACWLRMVLVALLMPPMLPPMEMAASTL